MCTRGRAWPRVRSYCAFASRTSLYHLLPCLGGNSILEGAEAWALIWLCQNQLLYYCNFFGSLFVSNSICVSYVYVFIYVLVFETESHDIVGTHCVGWAGLKLAAVLLQALECWDYRCASWHLALTGFHEKNNLMNEFRILVWVLILPAIPVWVIKCFPLKNILWV